MSILRSKRSRRGPAGARDNERSILGTTFSTSQGVGYAYVLDLNVIQDLTKRLGVSDGVRDFSLSLADGRALPDWIELQGHTLGIRSNGFAEVTLRMDLVYLDGHVGRFEVMIDANMTPLKLKVKPVGEHQQAQLFSTQLLHDDMPHALVPEAA